MWCLRVALRRGYFSLRHDGRRCTARPGLRCRRSNLQARALRRRTKNRSFWTFTTAPIMLQLLWNDPLPAAQLCPLRALPSPSHGFQSSESTLTVTYATYLRTKILSNGGGYVTSYVFNTCADLFLLSSYMLMTILFGHPSRATT